MTLQEHLVRVQVAHRQTVTQLERIEQESGRLRQQAVEYLGQVVLLEQLIAESQQAATPETPVPPTDPA